MMGVACFPDWLFHGLMDKTVRVILKGRAEVHFSEVLEAENVKMARSNDGYSSSTHFWGRNGTGGNGERLDPVDKERDAQKGWTKGGRLKIGKQPDCQKPKKEV